MMIFFFQISPKNIFQNLDKILRKKYNFITYLKLRAVLSTWNFSNTQPHRRICDFIDS